MEVAASVVGLILAAATVYKNIDSLISTYTNVPDSAKEILAEVRDFEYALKRLRTRIAKRNEMTPLGAMATDATQLAITLASCTLTFSQLERIIDELMPRRVKQLVGPQERRLPAGQMSVYSRLRWNWENSNLTILVRRIQQHKTTLTLLLTIWMSESSAEAESMVDSLNDIPETLTTVTKAIPTLVTSPASTVSLGPSSSPDIEHLPSHLGITPQVRCSESTSIMSVGSRMSFTAVLRNSRPYRNHDMLAPSTMSLATSQRRGAQWSTFSIGSNTSVFSLPFTEFQLSDKPLAEEPIIYNIVIPMKHDLLHNRARYPHSDWLQGLKRGVWVESDIPYLHHLLELDDPKLFGDVIPKWTETCKPILYFYTRTWVAMFGGENLMKALLDSGADPNSGFTIPLIHAAVRGDNEPALRVLLAAGADRTIRDSDGLTCLALAIKLGRAKIAEILSGELEKSTQPVSSNMSTTSTGHGNEGFLEGFVGGDEGFREVKLNTGWQL